MKYVVLLILFASMPAIANENLKLLEGNWYSSSGNDVDSFIIENGLLSLREYECPNNPIYITDTKYLAKTMFFAKIDFKNDKECPGTDKAKLKYSDPPSYSNTATFFFEDKDIVNGCLQRATVLWGTGRSGSYYINNCHTSNR